MNAKELIEEVIDLVDDDWVDEKRALKAINAAQVAVARKVLLPGLADGSDTVTTLTTGNEVALPTDYLRELYYCSVDGQYPNVWSNLMLLGQEMGHLELKVGPVTDVCTLGSNLFYMNSPSTAVTLNLRYYRKPTAMTRSAESYPDGLEVGNGSEEDYENAILSHAAWKLFLRIEAGVEGEAKDSTRHSNLFTYHIKEMQKALGAARPHRIPPIVEQNF
jgi:hypothetical protein